ncbi:serine/threonine-protein kinase [Actinokineospora fastidiosa]|uniref:non-specific serine/threonine protein kinase n=1 Tax=Actinokineospora fastidiosa TaxID=1816 RepID=A0A918LF53_9PSEU|nr:serine/threonine-protein kinase [Actinokineospora fastidiosa]GGS38873.1 serine/threonine protein kinase [Actinokineospora fastidiosa]
MSQQPGPLVAPGSQRVIAGRYRVLNELGRGGMGVVWLAEDTTIGRHVAIKELHLPDGVPAAERLVFEERVLREARTAGRLNDPAVVTVYDVVQESGATYIVMELIQAPTLADVVRERGPLKSDAVARLAEQLLSALESAHQAGIVHRDVKPSNIMLAANGRAKLTDFGIAQSVDDPRLTTSGLLIGSPAYLAPEQLRGESASAASDLWALGAVLFFAIEGYSPFERANTAATMHAILNEVPFLTRGSGALASVISGLLNTHPQARLTAAQVRGLLTHVQPGPPTGPHTGPTAMYPGGYPTMVAQPPQQQQPVRKRRMGWQLVLALASVIALAGGVLGFMLANAVNAPAEDEQATPITTFTYGAGGQVREFEVTNRYCGVGVIQDGASFPGGEPCDEPHAFEVYGYLTLNDDWDYIPTELTALGKSYCLWQFRSGQVEPGQLGRLSVIVLVPAKQAWEADREQGSPARTLVCALTSRDGSMLAESHLVEQE